MNRRLLWLGLVAVVLGLVLLLDRGGQPPEPRETPAPQAEQSPPADAQAPATSAQLNPLEGLDAGGFMVMLERPLFNADRSARPPAPPPEPPPPPMEEPPPEAPPPPPGPLAQDFVLVAVAAGPSGRIAVVRLAATGEVLYLREGQPVQSWAVMAVKDRSVVIGLPDSNVEITLFDDAGDEDQPPMDQAPPPEVYDAPPEVHDAPPPEIDLNQDMMHTDPIPPNDVPQ